jgi:hypothetical protein
LLDGHLGRESGGAMKRIKNDRRARTDRRVTDEGLRTVSGGGSEGVNGGGGARDPGGANFNGLITGVTVPK